MFSSINREILMTHPAVLYTHLQVVDTEVTPMALHSAVELTDADILGVVTENDAMLQLHMENEADLANVPTLTKRVEEYR